MGRGKATEKWRPGEGSRNNNGRGGGDKRRIVHEQLDNNNNICGGSLFLSFCVQLFRGTLLPGRILTALLTQPAQNPAAPFLFRYRHCHRGCTSIPTVVVRHWSTSRFIVPLLVWLVWAKDFPHLPNDDHYYYAGMALPGPGNGARLTPHGASTSAAIHTASAETSCISNPFRMMRSGTSGP